MVDGPSENQLDTASIMHQPWEAFVILVGSNKDYMQCPLYKPLLNHFPIPFLQKLFSIVVSGSTPVARNNASDLICYHFSDIFDENYSTLEAETLKSFQNDVLILLNSTSLTPEIHECTIAVASKLVSLTLLHRRKWTELLEFSSNVLASGNQSLDLILEIFCSQNVIYQYRFLDSFEPYFQIEHFNVLSSLLRKGDDYRAFMVLPSICLMLRSELWGSLMETAILSPFFDRETVSWRKLDVASSLRFCIQHSFFNFSSEMVIKVTRLIFRFLQSTDSRDNRMATRLCGALLGSCFSESLRSWLMIYFASS